MLAALGDNQHVRGVQDFEKQVTAEMQQVTEYFGEGYDATDPSKVLRVIRDFMMLFDKAILEIKVSGGTYLAACCLTPFELGRCWFWKEACNADITNVGPHYASSFHAEQGEFQSLSGMSRTSLN